ncbi:hypothetical protein ACWD2L_05985 [Streptomyces sp. NPDC002754]
MNNKNALLHLIDRAQRGALLPGEAQILRDAIELLDDMAMTLNELNINAIASYGQYQPSDTQTFRIIE